MFSLLLLATQSFYAQSPGLAQQALESIPQTTKIETPLSSTKKTQKEKEAELKAIIDQPSMQKALNDFLRHPYLTYTAKSVYSPAGIPMKWGGVGVAGDVFNRYPTQSKDTWSGAALLALPFGDSDRWLGGAVFLNNADLGKNSKFGNGGSIGLTFSRWFGESTIAIAGVSNLIPWGQGFSSTSKSYYGAVTQLFGTYLGSTLHQVSASVGVGTGLFGPLGEVDSSGTLLASNDNRIYPFVNTSYNITQNLSLTGDYYSQTFAAGISYNKVIFLPFSFMLYAGNLRHTRTAPSTTFGLRVSLGFPLPGYLANKS